MNTCEQIRDSLGAWLDGELSRADAQAVQLHVQGCRDCGAEQRELEKLDAAMKAVMVPAGGEIAFEPFWRGVRARIDERRPWYVEWSEQVRSWLTVPSLGWAVPAMIVLLLVAVSYDKFLPNWKGAAAPRNNFAAVESIDGYGRSVALLREDESKTTVIWLFQNQEGDDESSADKAPKGPTF